MRTFIAACCFGLLLAASAFAEPEIDFNSDIRPLLSDRCYQCHGPEEKSREAGLRLDLKESAFGKLESGETAVLPGDLAKSELVRRITSADEFEQMPPPESGKKLSMEEIDLLKRWIKQGANWNEHWAFVPPAKSPFPEVTNKAWPKNEIDYFILKKLETAGMTPGEEADKITLLRRVSFDLTGLPPTPEEVKAFLADSSADAYEKVVDRLLASPRYGENMARFWLDAARYGDTHGLHLDNYREMWPYRDWVVRSFNNNQSYRDFIIEQLAGDLLPNPTIDQLVATGFNRCHVTTSEGGSIEEEVYVRNVVDRVTTTGTVFMGLTMECTRCHDHKYDPLTMKDFYSMFAFFNSLEGGALDGNAALPPPVMQVPDPVAQQQKNEIQAQIAKLNEQLLQRKTQAVTSDAFRVWEKQEAESRKEQVFLPAGLLAHYPLDEGSGDTISPAGSDLPAGKLTGQAIWVDGKHSKAIDFNGKSYVDLGDVANFERDAGFSYGAWVNPRNNGGGAIISRMDDANSFRGWDMYMQQGTKVAIHIIHRWPNDALKVATTTDMKQGQWQHVFATYDGSSRPEGIKIYFDGVEQPLNVEQNSLKNTIQSTVKLRLGARTPGAPYNGLADDVRIYNRALTKEEVGVLAGADPIGPILATPPAQRTPAQIDQLAGYYVNLHDEKTKEIQNQIADLQEQEAAIQANGGSTLIWKERTQPKESYILERGEYDHQQDRVFRDTPATLPAFPADASKDRLGLAHWLTAPGHPLTARVQVNRFWQQLFGIGIVKTSEDFGSQGEPPSHPLLLDYLSVQFQEDGWNVKQLMKRMVMSATYRQSSAVTPAKLEKDPNNRLLSRGPRFRLDAEMLRDQALAVSGLLVNKLGGPSVKPPQPDGLWFAVGYSGSNTVRFKKDTGADKVYRRTLYTFIKRTAPPPQMSTFDAPSRESCIVRRERTNTPLQMLLLMNDPQYVEAARALAQRALQQGEKTPAERAAFMFELCTGRQPKGDESEQLLGFYEEMLKEFQSHQEQAAELTKVGETPPDQSMPQPDLAAWTMVANLILCLDEVVTKN